MDIEQEHLTLTLTDVDFYMVWTKTGWPPRYRWDTRSEAESEAIRLAHKHPGKTFIVLHGVHKVKVDTIAAEGVAA